MLRNGLVSVVGVGLLGLSVGVGSAWAQDASAVEPEIPPSIEAASGSDETAVEEPATEAEGPADVQETEPPPETTEDVSPEAETEDSGEASTTEAEPAPEPDTSEDADAVPAEEEAVADAGTDWAGLVERAPAFLALTHHAAVHLPIALWIFGALFVVIGVVAPSLRNQIPLACLVGGAVTSVGAAASGWWYADYEWGESWDWSTGLGDIEWSELLVQHRWLGVGLTIASCILAVLAIISVNRQRGWKLAWFWRLGLIALAAAVAFEGHIGGELIHGEGFLEEAFQEWVSPEE